MDVLMKIGIVILVITLYVALHYYVTVRCYRAWMFTFKRVNKKIFVGIFVFLALILIFKFLLMSIPVNSEAKQFANWVASVWMGFFVYLVILFAVGDIFILLLAGLKVLKLNDSVKNHMSLIALLIASCVCCEGIFNASRVVSVSYTVDIVRSEMAQECNIALISDLHLGAVNYEKRLANTVELVNEQNPDIICIVGDIFDSDYYEMLSPERACKLLRQLKSKYGVYACLGNHDAGSTFHEMEEFLEKSNINCLKEEFKVIDNQFVLVGRLDSQPIGSTAGYKRGNINEILNEVDKELPIVVMDHNPANIMEYDKNVDLVMCGHTHHGQIWPGKLITDSIFEVAYGHYQKSENSAHVIVTSGAGLWGMPMRLGSKCEVARITLK